MSSAAQGHQGLGHPGVCFVVGVTIVVVQIIRGCGVDAAQAQTGTMHVGGGDEGFGGAATVDGIEPVGIHGLGGGRGVVADPLFGGGQRERSLAAVVVVVARVVPWAVARGWLPRGKGTGGVLVVGGVEHGVGGGIVDG